MEAKNISLFLAPMAGAGDRAFREICASLGADVLCTEMISAKAIHFGDRKTDALAETGESERPVFIQIFGSEPDVMAEAAKHLADRFSPDGIDLNMGCPVPKILKSGSGSALMKNPALCYEIAARVKDAVRIPVSVKMRAGWDGESRNAPEIARLCEKAGVSRVAVHGRTKADLYRAGTLRPETIAAVRESVRIPVIANGDVRDEKSARDLLEKTGCPALMIGRGAIGAPWIFAELRAALEQKKPPVINKKEVILRHLSLAFRYKPEVAACEMRMHMAHYLKGFRGAAVLRGAVSEAKTLSDYERILSLIPEI